MGPDLVSPEEQFDVFLSHNSKDKPAVVELARLLGDRGLKVWLDMWELPPGSLWVKELEKIIRTVNATAVIVGKEGLGPWQDQELQAAMVQSVTRGMVLIPVILSGAPEDVEVTPFMGIRTWLNLRSGFTEEGIAGFEWGITGKKPEFARSNGALRPAPRMVRDYFSRQWPNTDPQVFGREKELVLLDQAWDEGKLNIVTLVAAGGVGKTALVNRWAIYHMTPDGWRGAERVFAWSFYSQGSTEGRYSSSDIFLAEAMRWFGDEECAASALDPYSKGQRLAALVREKRTLLLLDGAEPLQEPPGAAAQHPGQIQDMGLKGLLKGLAFTNPGLCVISTRMEVADLKSYSGVGGTVLSVDLDDLSPESGMAYLKSMGVSGPDAELLQASKDFGNNALALTLLGHCLSKYHRGDVRRRKEIQDLFRPKQKGRHARGVMAWYAKIFEGKPEGELLSILGLFDRPAEPGAVEAVRSGKKLKGLTEHLSKLSSDDWLDVLESLREARLLSRDDSESESASRLLGHRASSTMRDMLLDSHPLVREYFGERLKKEYNKAWKAAHDRLYEYYKALPDKDLPVTIEEMVPLFHAVFHGCQTGRCQNAFEDVYRSRIHQLERMYSVHHLGAFGTELSMLTSFFDKTWNVPRGGLEKQSEAFILSIAAFHLRALGRFVDSLVPLQAGFKAVVAQNAFRNASIAAINLCEVHLALGNVRQALDYAQQSVRYAEDIDSEFQRVVGHSKIADTLHHVGRTTDAAKAFSDAEVLQREWQPHHPLLYSLQGFLYCDLVLAQGGLKDVQLRVGKSIEWRKSYDSLLDIALDHLTLGRVALATAHESASKDYSEVASRINTAVKALRDAGAQEFVVRGLLVRAGMYRCQRDLVRANQDLSESWDIASRGGLLLFQCDIHLECARAFMAMAEVAEMLDLSNFAPDSPFRLYLGGAKLDDAKGSQAPTLRAARAHIAEAARLITKTGYHRRDPELLLETARLEFLEGQVDVARATLARAKARVDEMGAHGLDFDVRALEKLIG